MEVSKCKPKNWDNLSPIYNPTIDDIDSGVMNSSANNLPDFFYYFEITNFLSLQSQQAISITLDTEKQKNKNILVSFPPDEENSKNDLSKSIDEFKNFLQSLEYNFYSIDEYDFSTYKKLLKNLDKNLNNLEVKSVLEYKDTVFQNIQERSVKELNENLSNLDKTGLLNKKTLDLDDSNTLLNIFSKLQHYEMIIKISKNNDSSQESITNTNKQLYEKLLVRMDDIVQKTSQAYSQNRTKEAPGELELNKKLDKIENSYRLLETVGEFYKYQEGLAKPNSFIQFETSVAKIFSNLTKDLAQTLTEQIKNDNFSQAKEKSQELGLLNKIIKNFSQGNQPNLRGLYNTYIQKSESLKAKFKEALEKNFDVKKLNEIYQQGHDLNQIESNLNPILIPSYIDKSNNKSFINFSKTLIQANLDSLYSSRIGNAVTTLDSNEIIKIKKEFQSKFITDASNKELKISLENSFEELLENFLIKNFNNLAKKFKDESQTYMDDSAQSILSDMKKLKSFAKTTLGNKFFRSNPRAGEFEKRIYEEEFFNKLNSLDPNKPQSLKELGEAAQNFIDINYLIGKVFYTASSTDYLKELNFNPNNSSLKTSQKAILNEILEAAKNSDYERLLNLSSYFSPNYQPKSLEFLESNISILKILSNADDSASAVASEDSQRVIKEIILSSTEDFYDDLKLIGEKQGFTVRLISSVKEEKLNSWIEDWAVAREDGKILLPNPVIIELETLDRLKTLSGLNDNEIFQGNIAESRAIEKILLEMNSEELKKFVIGESYIEFGNLLTAKKADGSKHAIIGEDTAIINAALLDSRKKFSPEDISKRIKEMEAKGDFDKVNYPQIISRLARVGLLPGTIDNEAKEQEAVKNFLAKVDLAKDIIAKDLGLARTNTSYIKQPDFHIDMHLRPGPGDLVFVNDDSEVIKLIDQILRSRQDITNKQKSMLEKYKSNAEKSLSKSSIITETIKNQLKLAGFTPVSTPGVFKDPDYPINFMNGIMAQDQSQSNYYITNSSSIQFLEGEFADFMKKHSVEEIFFIGKRGAQSSLRKQGGLDCRTVEIEK